MKISVVILILLSSVCGNGHSQGKSIVGSLATTEQIEKELDGCACRLGYVFVSRMDGKVAWMNIAGKTERLLLATSTRADTPSTDFSRQYSGKGMTIKIFFHRVVEPSSSAQNTESDGFSVNATIRLTKGKHKEMIKVSGQCAC